MTADQTPDALGAEPRDAAEWRQRIERKLVLIVIALEIGSSIMVLSLLLVYKAQWWAIVLTLALILLGPWVLSLSNLRIWLEDDRLRWRFVPFWGGKVRYADIESVEPVERVDAMNDFMGWGVKIGKKGLGVIARSGPAVRIVRTGKRDLWLTCDDADGLAAALLERLVESYPAGDAGAGLDEAHAD